MAESAAPFVLVTGASGFVSTWLIKELLEKGEYRVRGTVRNKSKQEKVQPLLDLVPDAKYPLELVEADLSSTDCWGPAVEGCTYVFHVASPFPTDASKSQEPALISQAVSGVTNVLEACSKSGTVKRVVVTSSVAAVSSGMGGNPGRPNDYKYTEEDWSVEEACPPYEKSKLKAEQAGWDFVKKLEGDKAFELVVVNPAYIQGPLLSAASGGGTATLPKTLLERGMPAVPNARVGIVDVRDVVAGEIAAMFTPSAAGKRYILCGGTSNFRDIAVLLRNEFLSQGYNVPTGTIPKPILWGLKFLNSQVKNVYPGVNKNHTWSNERMRNELGVTPQPLEKSILDTCYSLIELGLVEKKPGYLGPPDKREQSPASEPKPTEGETAEPKPTKGETAEPKPTEGETAEPKPTEGETAEPKPTEGESAEPKPTEGETAEAKPTKGETAEPKPNEGETAEPKPTEGETAEPKQTEGESAEPKPTEGETVEPTESSEPQPTDQESDKPSEGDNADPKPSEGGTAEPSDD